MPRTWRHHPPAPTRLRYHPPNEGPLRLLLLLPLLAPGACGKDPGPSSDPAGPATTPDSGDPTEAVWSPLEPWLRDEEEAPGSIRFNELLYHPAEDPDAEWLELHNPMALSVDLSGWTLAGGVDFGFPEGTVLPGGGFLVVAADPTRVPGALGPYTGRLADGGERLDLRDNSGRRIDTVGYGDDDPWPVAADGSGLSLAKRSADTASDRAESWTVSSTLGGTPAADNQLDPDLPPVEITLVEADATWAYDLSGDYPASDWDTPDYDDTAWDRGAAVFYAGAAEASAEGTLHVTADNYYAAWLGTADGADLRLVAEDVDGLWYSVDTFVVDVGPEDHLYVAAWEAPSDYGGPQMAIAEVVLPDDVVGTDLTRFEWALGAPGACPGVTPPDPAPPAEEIAALIADADTFGDWAAPAVDADRNAYPWGGSVGAAFDPATRFVWPDTFADTSVTNTENTYVLFRSVAPLLGDRGATELPGIPLTSTFRTTFSFDGDPAATSLALDCRIDDGARVTLNGVEILRDNLPDGAVDASTPALVSVTDATPRHHEVSAAALVRGENLLAVELHQALADDPDLTFGCALTATIHAAAAGAAVVLDEIAPATDTPWWVDLHAVGGGDVDLAGLVLVSSSGGEHAVPAGTLPAGGWATVADVGFGVAPGDVVFLYDADRTQLLDAVRVAGAGRARAPEGGPWRWPTEATPGAENRIDVEDAVVIDEIHYHHPPVVRDGEAYAESPEEWIELTNRGATAVDLGGWQLVDAVSYTFPTGTVLEPGAFLVVAADAAALRAAHPDATVLGDFDGNLGNTGDHLLLRDARGNPADEVAWSDDGRWPAQADGGGSSLELRDLHADNAAPEAWAASDPAAGTTWATYSWRGVAEPSAVGPDGVWQELLFGLLDAGEVWIDDVHVVQDPAGTPVDIVQNGTFDAGGDHWRLLGNHRRSAVVPDPEDPANPVLHLVATGPTGHMHNHVETTTTRPIEAREYEISFRARWGSGSNQLHTRLYFQRLPRVTRVARPDTVGSPGAPNGAAVADIGPTFTELDQDVAVPDPYQPVEVRVGVADPDGVARVSLFSSVDGGPFVSAPMTEGTPGVWSASVDGEAAGTIVQLYVEAEDGRGSVSTFPAAGPDSRALLTFDDGRAATHGLHNLRILLTPADDAWLHEDVNLMSDEGVGATVVVDESEVFHDVAVRTKGSERGRPEVARLGYALHFPGAHRFRGTHRTVLVDRSEGVGYGQREVLMNLVMTHAGAVSGEYNDLVQAITPRVEHTGPAELQLDRATDLLLDAQFEDGAAGSLFEYELVYFPLTTDDGTPEGLKLPQPDSVVGTAITDLGEDPEAWRWTFLLQNNVARDDFTPIQTLGRTFALRGNDFLLGVEPVIDVDQWLRAFAFATLSGAVDNYGGDGAQHNARFYVRPADGRILYFPHDLDYMGSSQGALVGNGDLSRLLQSPRWLRAYYGHLADIVGRAYNEAWLEPWCAELAELLPGQDFAGHCRFVGDRADWVMFGASDAVMTRFPTVPFQILTGGGATVEVEGVEVVLDGEAWVDVSTIVLEGSADPLGVTWTDPTHWEVTVPVASGKNAVVLVATDMHGAEVGRDEVVVVGR